MKQLIVSVPGAYSDERLLTVPFDVLGRMANCSPMELPLQ